MGKKRRHQVGCSRCSFPYKWKYVKIETNCQVLFSYRASGQGCSSQGISSLASSSSHQHCLQRFGRFDSRWQIQQWASLLVALDALGELFQVDLHPLQVFKMLNNKESLDQIIVATPGLSSDPVALGTFRSRNDLWCEACWRLKYVYYFNIYCFFRSPSRQRPLHTIHRPKHAWHVSELHYSKK